MISGMKTQDYSKLLPYRIRSKRDHAEQAGDASERPATTAYGIHPDS